MKINKPYDIWVDAFRLTTEHGTSGCAYCRILVRALLEHPDVASVTLLLPRRDHKPLPELGVPDSAKLKLAYPGAPMHPEKTFPSQFVWTQFTIPGYLRKIGKTGLLLCLYHHTPVSAGRGYKVVTFIHDVCGLSLTMYTKWQSAHYRHRWMLGSAAACADALIPISHYTRSEFLGIYKKAAPRMTRPVWNAVELTALPEEVGKAALGELGLERHDYFFAIGSVSSRKGLDRVVDAYAEYRRRGGRRKIVILIPASGRPFAKAMIERAGIHDGYGFQSDVPDKVLHALYWGAAAFLFLSRCEGFGYPVVEAMSQGCPVLSSSNGPSDELMEGVEGSKHLVGLSNSGEVATAMFAVDVLSSDDRASIAHALSERAKHFCIERYGAQVVNVIAEMLG